MAIPESQLTTWSSQGSVIQSAQTYGTIKLALESKSTTYADKDYEIFLQGSYGNDTNVYADSDVDVIIKINALFSAI
jgi:tRNA nucleotidyltransferase (CCA-adding enzyme)